MTEAEIKEAEERWWNAIDAARIELGMSIYSFEKPRPSRDTALKNLFQELKCLNEALKQVKTSAIYDKEVP